jgi:hypothetical protein
MNVSMHLGVYPSVRLTDRLCCQLVLAASVEAVRPAVRPTQVSAAGEVGNRAHNRPVEQP